MAENVWVVRLRGQADPVLYWTREEVLADESVKYDLECAGDEDLEVGLGEDHIYVDDGFDAHRLTLPSGGVLARIWEQAYCSGVADTYQAIDHDQPGMEPARVNPYAQP